jgi:hypothetical protein
MDKEEQLAEARKKAAEVNKGNTHSSKINRLASETLKRVLVQEEAIRLRQVTEALVAKAEGGDVSAIKEIFDRIDGKVVQENKITGDSNEPVTIKIVTGIE